MWWWQPDPWPRWAPPTTRGLSLRQRQTATPASHYRRLLSACPGPQQLQQYQEEVTCTPEGGWGGRGMGLDLNMRAMDQWCISFKLDSPSIFEFNDSERINHFSLSAHEGLRMHVSGQNVLIRGNLNQLVQILHANPPRNDHWRRAYYRQVQKCESYCTSCTEHYIYVMPTECGANHSRAVQLARCT